MSNRQALATAFLNTTAWASATRAPLSGDASNRRYERLTNAASGLHAVLMDAPPEKGEDVRPFVKIATYLTDAGFSAPQVLAQDAVHGFLLLEDLGDALYARLLEVSPMMEAQIYECATDTLVALHQHVLPDGLRHYGSPQMAELAALAYTWYRNALVDAPADTAGFQTRFAALLDPLGADSHVVIQRDYHAENLLWLPDRAGTARVGLLDFQDAMIGHPAYDLVSLLQDARRDVPPETEAAMIARFVAKSGNNPDSFASAYHLLGAQRNLRILGVFARLCIRDGKQSYIDLIPRVWGLLQRDLDHPALAPIADTIRSDLPAPTPEALTVLKKKCATHQ